MSVPNKNRNIDISVDEIISLLKRTSLPTIIVEGCDDMIVYRALEERLAHLGISMLPVGGRGKVLDVFKRTGEVPTSVSIAFIADQDIWVNVGIPPEYVDNRIVFTAGYSIENDVFLDGELWRLLKGPEIDTFESELNNFLEWYALALNRHLQNESEPISLHPDHVLNATQRPSLLALRDAEQYPMALKEQLISEYGRLVRGKSLIALLVRNTNYKGRNPRHTDKALLESVAIRPGPLLEQLAERVEQAISARVPPM